MKLYARNSKYSTMVFTERIIGPRLLLGLNLSCCAFNLDIGDKLDKCWTASTAIEWLGVLCVFESMHFTCYCYFENRTFPQRILLVCRMVLTILLYRWWTVREMMRCWRLQLPLGCIVRWSFSLPWLFQMYWCFCIWLLSGWFTCFFARRSLLPFYLLPSKSGRRSHSIMQAQKVKNMRDSDYCPPVEWSFTNSVIQSIHKFDIFVTQLAKFSY